jgi:hypothetical protein
MVFVLLYCSWSSWAVSPSPRALSDVQIVLSLISLWMYYFYLRVWKRWICEMCALSTRTRPFRRLKQKGELGNTIEKTVLDFETKTVLSLRGRSKRARRRKNGGEKKKKGVRRK